MGIFRRIAREQQRLVEGRQRIPELAEAMKIQLNAFDEIQNPQNPNFERANTPEHLKKLVNASRVRRDESIKLNLYDYAALFSTIHCRIYLRLNQEVLVGIKSPSVRLGIYGNYELSSLHDDVRYLAWGVNKAGVDPREYWECKEMVDLYQSRIIEYAKSKMINGSIPVIDDFVHPPREAEVRWIDYEKCLLPPTNLMTPPVPPLKN